MYLFINTSEAQKNEVALLDEAGSVVARESEELKNRRSNKLLALLNRVICSQREVFRNIKGILVVEGPGPFSAVRTGVVAANILSFDQGIPVTGVRAGSSYDFPDLVKSIKNKKEGIALPFYGKEPNITAAKK